MAAKRIRDGRVSVQEPHLHCEGVADAEHINKRPLYGRSKVVRQSPCVNFYSSTVATLPFHESHQPRKYYMITTDNMPISGPEEYHMSDRAPGGLCTPMGMVRACAGRNLQAEVPQPPSTFFLDQVHHFAEEETLFNPTMRPDQAMDPTLEVRGLGIMLTDTVWHNRPWNETFDTYTTHSPFWLSTTLSPSMRQSDFSISQFRFGNEPASVNASWSSRTSFDDCSPTTTAQCWSGPMTPASSEVARSSNGSVQLDVPGRALSAFAVAQDPHTGPASRHSYHGVYPEDLKAFHAESLGHGHHNDMAIGPTLITDGNQQSNEPEIHDLYGLPKNLTTTNPIKHNPRSSTPIAVHKRRSKRKANTRDNTSTPGANVRLVQRSEDTTSESVRRERDKFLLDMRAKGMAYADIKKVGRFTEAESTLRGRHRSLIKQASQRVRKPEWTQKDVELLRRGVSRYVNDGVYQRVPWKRIAEFISDKGGSYLFGPSTVSNKWKEISGSA